jgi:hypothetical protein
MAEVGKDVYCNSVAVHGNNVFLLRKAKPEDISFMFSGA